MHKPLGPVAVFGASRMGLGLFRGRWGHRVRARRGQSCHRQGAPGAPPSARPGRAGHSPASVKACALPEGVFSLLFDSGVDVGVQLVKHAAMKAVAFTGSFAGGTALMKLAAVRPEPIPCYSEMGSVNPVFVLPGALKQRGSAVAPSTGFLHPERRSALHQARPGAGAPARRHTGIHEGVGRQGQRHSHQTLLTRAIADRYKSAVKGRLSDANVLAQGASADTGTDAATVQASLFVADYKDLMEHEELAQEIFGPTTVVVGYQDRKQLLAVAEQLEGHLTATLQADENELADYADLIGILSRKVGRLILNAYPTGVEVCHAMVHGGPFPATSDGRSTSVGSQAIFRSPAWSATSLFPTRRSRMSSRATTPSESCAWWMETGHASPPPSVPLRGLRDDRPAIPVDFLATLREGWPWNSRTKTAGTS